MLANSLIFPKVQINAIATRALIDEEFKAGILNGTRSKKLEEYPLPENFHNAVLGIEAKNLSQFIFQLQEIIKS